jgi:hypothetical protein
MERQQIEQPLIGPYEALVVCTDYGSGPTPFLSIEYMSDLIKGLNNSLPSMSGDPLISEIKGWFRDGTNIIFTVSHETIDGFGDGTVMDHEYICFIVKSF